MNLVIDIGNTRTKFSLFNHGEMMISVPVNEFLPEHIELLKSEHPSLNRAILSSVKKYPQELKEKLTKSFEQFVELDVNTPLPIQNCYESAETLGKDRIAAAVGAFDLYPDSNVLIIDAGTAITYDIVNDKNQYIGGNISPGLSMRFKALHEYTDGLPLVHQEDFSQLFGKTTRQAILAGVQHGLIFEEFYNNLKVIITGGDVKFFDKKLKSSFFVHFNLIATGLNRILQHNGEI